MRSTAYIRHQALRRLLRHIGAATGDATIAAEVPRLRRPRPRTQLATPEDLQKLCAAAPVWMRTIILLAAHAGFRSGDARTIAPEHYDAEKRTITITQEKTQESVTVPVTDELAALLEAAPVDNPLVSPRTPFYQIYRGGRPISAMGFNCAWNKLKKRAGVTAPLWVHDLRRTVAVSLYDVSKDLRVVAQVLGHTSIATTARYIEHRDTEKLRPYLDAIFIPKGRVQ